MKRCTDEKLGVLMHAYELGQLNAELQDAFELHLLSCEHCFEQVSEFDAAAELLRSNTNVQQQIRSAAVVQEPQESIFSRLRELFWPRQSIFLKPALTYMLILLLAYPAYIGVRHLKDQPVQGVQSLLLTGTRSTGGQEITAGEPLVLMFRISGARKGSFYRVLIQSEDMHSIYEDAQFNNINDREMASLFLSADALKAGRYTIVVYLPDTDKSIHEYEFVVE
jgi:hypothetical protein